MAKKKITVAEPGVAEETTDQAKEVEGTVPEQDKNGEQEPKKTAAKPKGESKSKLQLTKRGARHSQSLAQLDREKLYPIDEAIELVKKTSYVKFDASVDVHIHLERSKKTDEVVRGLVTLPHGTGRERKVVIITDEILEKIEKGWFDFDIAVTTPEMMPKLAKIAKILGPKGLMPNPKSGTVTSEPEKVATQLKTGKIEYKADSLGNIHQSIGRVSWPNEKLAENFHSLLAAVPKNRIAGITLAPTMGAGVKVAYTLQ